MPYTFISGDGSVLTADSSIISGVIQRPIVNIGSVLSAIPTTFSGAPSISGTVGASIIGLTPVAVTNTPSISGTVVVQNLSGSIAALLQSTNASVITVGSPIANQSVSGTIGASVIGTVPVTQSGPWSASLVGTISGSVVSFQGGTWQPSALGYVTRNDAVASFVGANLTTRPLMSDSAGRGVNKPFAPEEARVEGYNSVVSTSVTTLVPAAGAGLRNYITDVWVANTGASATLVTFRSQGGASILGYTIAPASGGSNLPGLATPIRTGVNETFDIQATTATSILFATVKGFKAP